MNDAINSPPHYRMGELGVEACDIAKALMTPDQWHAHCVATALYYVLRLGRKDSPAQDAGKAIWWLTWVAKGDPRVARQAEAEKDFRKRMYKALLVNEQRLDELSDTKARLAEAERLLKKHFPHFPRVGVAEEVDAFLYPRATDSASVSPEAKP